MKDQPQEGETSYQGLEKNEIRKLAQCVVEILRIDSQKIEDPFECYAHQLKMRVYQDDRVLQDRVILGYRVLLEYLLDNKMSSD